MEVRLCPELGGDGTRLGINVSNNTGSDVLTIFDTDLTSFEMLSSLLVEVRLVRPGSLVPWIIG